MEQRAVIKFYAKLSKNASETFWLMQQVYGDDCLSRANFFCGINVFWKAERGYKMIIVREGQFHQCSLHSPIVKELSTGNSFQLVKQLFAYIISMF